jgi:hypothetical protein
MHLSSRLTLSVLAGFAGIAFWGIVRLGLSQAALVWPLEANRPGQTALWGRYPQSDFGGALAAGDVNGDGFDDLIANARYVSEITLAGGEVYVLPGPLAFNTVLTMPQSVALVFQGIAPDQPQIGSDLESGDIDGDGHDDIVIASLTHDQTYVYWGTPAIQAGTLTTVPVSPQTMGLTVLGAGDGLILCDLNADGFEDLFFEEALLGSSSLDLTVWGVLGSAALGSSQGVTLSLPVDADVLIDGMPLYFWSSPINRNLACGDIDADGYPDLAIGAFGASPPYRNGAGIIYVVRGGPMFTHAQPVTLTMPGQAGAIIEGVDGRIGSTGDMLGSSLALADVNRDGHADLIAGAPGASGPDNLMQYAGEVYLWLGRALEGQRFTISAQASWIVYGAAPSDFLGGPLAAADFDGDASAELFLGCTGCENAGPPSYLSGRGYVLEPLDVTGYLSVTAASRLEVLPYRFARGLGWAVEALDLDGSGVSDLVISAPWTNYPEGNLPGTVYVISYPIRAEIFLSMIQQ